MSKNDTIAQSVMEHLDELARANGIKGTDWYELLEDLEGRIQCYKDCYREENPEEFE